MAFFGVNHLGYQDHIQEHVRLPDVYSPQYVFRSGKYRDPEYKMPPVVDRSELPQPSLIPRNQTSGYGAGPMGSYKELMRLRHKHIRTPQEPIDVYRRPCVNSHWTAEFRKDEPLSQKEQWTKVPRFVHKNSEMTKFVDDMAMTNKLFSMF